MTRTRDYHGVVSAGMSRAADPEQAAREAMEAVDPAACAFILTFIPPRLDPAGLARALDGLRGGAAVFGCTTAGQICENGYDDEALLVIGFPRRHFRCASTLIRPLGGLSIDQAAQQLRDTAGHFRRTARRDRFAIMLTDGLSKQEDILVAAIEAGLEGVPVFGGSAGDGLAFDRTFVLHGGQAHTDAGLVIIVETDLGFVGLGFDHFMPTEKRLVVTGASPDERIVEEINGSPAAREYARLAGCAEADLSPLVFAENPLLVRNGSAYHVRAVQEVLPGGRLAFLSAIGDGLIMTLGAGKDILTTLEAGLDLADPGGRRPCFILGFDCILRRLEIEQKGLRDEVSRRLGCSNTLGF